MSKIYKDFEEWYRDIGWDICANSNELFAPWSARQPEIDQLKQRINSLESIIKRVADDMDSTFILPTAIAIISELGGTLKEQPK